MSSAKAFKEIKDRERKLENSFSKEGVDAGVLIIGNMYDVTIFYGNTYKSHQIKFGIVPDDSYLISYFQKYNPEYFL